ncbi:MAG: MarR family transcriptional regulator [Proteobacteria bacterium]|nr:MarR family transcriptional regulator [Pseudomonadota bacterium]
MTNGSRSRDSIQEFINAWRRERPDLDAWPLGILGRVQRLAAALVRRSEKKLAPMGLTWEAFSLIVTLRRTGPPFQLRPTDIYKQSLLSSGAVTNRIDRVEKMGLVKRVPDPEDRRSLMVRLTPAGRKLADQAIAAQFETLIAGLSGLAKKEREELARLLAKALISLEKSPE